MADISDIRSGDVKKLLKELGDESSSSEKIRSILKTIWIFSSENKDAAHEILEDGIVENLVELFMSVKGKVFQGQIASILSLLSFEKSGDDEDCSDIILVALSKIDSKTNVVVFLQCMAGMKNIATFFNKLKVSDPSSPPPPPLHFLSVGSCASVFERAATLLASPSLKEMMKVEVLGGVLQLVGAGVMNEAVAFVNWCRFQSQDQAGMGKEGGGGRGGGGGGKSEINNSLISAERFLKGFETFTKAIKEISSLKWSVLGFAAAEALRSIQENKFFPHLATFGLISDKTEKQAAAKTNLNLPMTFLVNTTGDVTNSGSKLVWNNNKHHTFFVDREINEGLYKFVIEIGGGNLWSTFGLAVKGILTSLANNYFFSQSSGTCCLNQEGGIYCGSTCVYRKIPIYPSSGTVTLGLELDVDKHTLCFFVDGEQIPHRVVNIPPSVHFGISGYYQGFSAEIKSFTKLVNHSINSALSCSDYVWK